MNIKKYLIFLALALYASCEMQPDIQIPDIAQSIVVDGWIEHDGYAYVLLTYNTPYFSNLDSASFRGLVATRAKITLSDGERSEILTLRRDTHFFPPFVYRSFEIIGESGKSYQLTIEDEIGTATATTTIPPVAKPDSLWFEYLPDNDSLGFIKGIMALREPKPNYYRAFTRMANSANKRRYYPAMVSLFADNWVNDKSLTFSIKKGPETYLKPVENIFFKKGDSIVVRIASIDNDSYQFWRSYQNEVSNSGNPFAANHSKIKSNINNGLGIWCGYGASYRMVVAK